MYKSSQLTDDKKSNSMRKHDVHILAIYQYCTQAVTRSLAVNA